jgi:hypothetical protein
MTDLNYFVIAVRSAGVPAFPELIELVLPAAQKASDETGLSLEYAVIEQAKAVWAAAHQKSKAGFGQNVDFPAFVREKLGKKDSLISRLLVRKSKVQQAVVDAEQLETEIIAARNGLNASQAKVEEITNDIATTEAELSNHNEAAVQASIEEAARIWHLRHRSPHNSSVVDANVDHAVQSEVTLRILDARLIYLRDLLAKEQEKVEAFKQQLRDLEKQL